MPCPEPRTKLPVGPYRQGLASSGGKRDERPGRTRWVTAAIVVMLPVMVLTNAIQREIVQGLPAGGVK